MLEFQVPGKALGRVFPGALLFLPQRRPLFPPPFSQGGTRRPRIERGPTWPRCSRAGGAACSGGRRSAEGAEDLLGLSRVPAPGPWHTLLPPHCLRSPPRNHWPSLRECVGAVRKRLPRQPCSCRPPPFPEGMRHTLHRPTLSSRSSFLSRCGLWGWVVVQRTWA